MPGDDFMQEIIDMITSLVKTYEKVKGAEVLLPKEGVSLGKCPMCGKPVVERPKSYSCSDRECKFALWKNDPCSLLPIGKSMNSTVAKTVACIWQGQAKGLRFCKDWQEIQCDGLDEPG